MENIGLKVPQSAIAHNMDDVRRIGSSMPFPMIIRPAFTLGGTGGGIARRFPYQFQRDVHHLSVLLAGQ